MTAKRKTANAQDKYDDLVLDYIKDISRDLKENTKETKLINSRVYKLESKVFSKKDSIEQLVPFWRDAAVLKLLSIVAIGGVILLVIYAGLKGIDLSGVPLLGN